MKKKLDETTYEIAFRDGVIQMANTLKNSDGYEAASDTIRGLPIDYDGAVNGWNDFIDSLVKRFITVDKSLDA